MLLEGIEHRYSAVDISLPRDQRPDDFRRVSLFGEVPVLLHDDQALVQSNAILLHLVRFRSRSDVGAKKQWDEITSWLFWEANRIGRSYPNLRWYRKFENAGDPGLIAWFESTAKSDLRRLNDELADKPFLLGVFSVVDISCAGYLLYGDDVGIDMRHYPHVSDWLERIRSLPGWQHPFACMGNGSGAS